MATNKKDKPSEVEEETKTGSAEDVCPICCGPIVVPLALPCKHTFCKTCIKYLVKQRSYYLGQIFPGPVMRCPVCREMFCSKKSVATSLQP